MIKSETVRANIKPELKGNAEKVFRQLGLTATQAITLLYKQVELRIGNHSNVEVSAGYEHHSLYHEKSAATGEKAF